MPQRPVKLSRIQRVRRTPESPAAQELAPNAGASDSGRVTWMGQDEWARRAAERIRSEAELIAEPSPRPEPAAPARGDTLPDTSGGKVCRTCWAYAIDPAGHDRWHREQDERARRFDWLRRLVLDVFQARGYITSNENTTPTAGDTEKAN